MQEIVKFLALFTFGISFASLVYFLSLFIGHKRNIYIMYCFYLIATMLLCMVSYYFTFTINFLDTTDYIIYGHGTQIMVFIFLSIFIKKCMNEFLGIDKNKFNLLNIGIYLLIFYFFIYSIPSFIFKDKYFLWHYNKLLFLIIRIILFSLILIIWFVYFKGQKNLFGNFLFLGIFLNLFFVFIAFITQANNMYIFNLRGVPFVFMGTICNIFSISVALSKQQNQLNKNLELALKEKIEMQATINASEINAIKLVNREKTEERLRIARDLHDDTGSLLSSISLYSQVAQKYTQSNYLKADELLNKIDLATNKATDNISDIVWSLQISTGKGEHIFDKMDKLAKEWLYEKNIEVDTFYSNKPQFPELNIEQRKNIWLIFKEGINNIAKYSQATKVSIKVYNENNIIYLLIKDNGLGFDIEKVKGNGLQNMQQRAKTLNGNIAIWSKPNNGTNISFECPVLSK